MPPVQQGSIAIWTYQVARRIAQRSPIIVYAKTHKDCKSSETSDGVTYRRVSTFPNPFGRLGSLATILRIDHRLVSSAFDHPSYFKGYAERVAKDIRKRSVDIVHIHNLSQFVPVIRRYNPDVKIIIHMHCEWLTQIPKHIVTERLQAANLVVGCSKYVTRTITDSFPDAASRSGTLYNGVDVDAFSPTTRSESARTKHEKVLLFVGRVSPEKGLHDLIDAFERVVQKIPNTRLVIVGPVSVTPKQFLVSISRDPLVRSLDRFYNGDYLENLKNRVAPEITNKITFVGNVHHNQLARYYEEADLLINPSLSESFGMSLIEANACGIPVVATRVGGMKEAVSDRETGYLVAPQAPNELEEAIITLLENDDERRRMGMAGRERVKRLFSWDRITMNTLECYTKMNNL